MIAINKVTGAKIEITRYGLALLGPAWSEYKEEIKLPPAPPTPPAPESDKPYPYEDIAEDFIEPLVTTEDQPEVVPVQETAAPDKAQPKTKTKRERK